MLSSSGEFYIRHQPTASVMLLAGRQTNDFPMRPYLLAFCCSILIGAHAQDAILVGTITDAVTKEPLFGATASWALGQGTSSDMDGGYRVVAPKGGIVVTFSMIGYEPLELRVTTVPGQETRLDAAMKPPRASWIKWLSAQANSSSA